MSPRGANADCNDIPDTVDADSGLASLSAFFPQLAALPLSAGAHTHNLSIAPAGAHSHSVTVASNGKHTHNLSIAAAGAHAHSVAIAAAGAHTHAITIGKTGSGAAFSILPPYIAVYMWRRTA